MSIQSTRAAQRAFPSRSDIRDDSRAERNIAKRNARAILIAGDQVGSSGTPTPGALDALDLIEQHLTSRFAPSDVKIERLVGRPTKQLVANAFQSMTKIVQSGELFVVVFAGHGIAASSGQPSQSWSLAAGETFTDGDLAAALLALPPGVDTVVLSDCCFGEGLFQVEQLGDQPPEQQPRNSAMVCISAAGKDNLVELSKLANLARQTVAAADAKQSYRQLASTFASQAVAGCTFHVDARPAHRLDDLVLNPERRRPVTVSRRPVKPNRRPPARRTSRGLVDIDHPRSTVCASAQAEHSQALPLPPACQEPRCSGA